MPFTPQQYRAFAQQMFIAIKGLGTDEQALLNVYNQCTTEDIVQIARMFTGCYGFEMDAWVKGDVSGNFGKIMVGCSKPRYSYWATQIHKAVAGLGTDNMALIELVILADEQDIKAIRNEYFRLFKADVQEDIKDDISKNADWARLVKAWWSSFRYERNNVQNDAMTLYKAAKGAGTDEQVFIEMLCTTTVSEYKQICESFKLQFKKDLRDTIISEFSGKSEYCYLLAHDFLIDPAKAVSFAMYKAIKGLGTRDRTLVNCTVLFRDRYRDKVPAYYVAYGNLASDFKGDTSGWYEKTLLQLWRVQ
ncbi:Annexin_2 [Hexamita inflata]|uniref:Annexin 2 n=1 Tax=Hexamita inflata TaxID=28002 RepID=A0AA86UJN0_9EUKA|nr:Annexin 2 [Hexamita inflata]